MNMEGKEEKELMDIVYCFGFGKNVTFQSCKDKCSFYGGIHKEPVEGRNESGERVVIKYDEYLICNKPKLVPVAKLCEVG